MRRAGLDGKRAARVGGRMLLWGMVAVIFLTGLSSIVKAFGGEPEQAPRAAQRDREPEWPNEQARAFALEFTAAYLAWQPGQPQQRLARLERFMAHEVASTILPELPEHGAEGGLPSLTVAGVEPVARDRALIVVSAGGRRLSVPVQRDKDGKLAVYDAPAFVAAAPPGEAEREPTDVVNVRHADEIAALVKRFLRAYLRADIDGVRLLAAPGVELGAVTDELRLATVETVEQVQGERDVVLATVFARSPRGAMYMLRYRLGLQQVKVGRDSRWLVASVNAGKGSR